MNDIIFLSYDESNAERNWKTLSQRFPQAKRIHGVVGVKEAHRRAAELSATDFFFIVDGDNEVFLDFEFQLDFTPQKDTLYVWRCLNPVNDLCYGYGGVKLYNKYLLLELQKPTAVDVATSIAIKYQPVFKTASTTYFNSTPLEAWRGAFREAVKLCINLQKNPQDKHSRERLEAWCSKGMERSNGLWCLRGAMDGKNYFFENYQEADRLALINDFSFLKKRFEEASTNSSPLPSPPV